MLAKSLVILDTVCILYSGNVQNSKNNLFYFVNVYSSFKTACPYYVTTYHHKFFKPNYKHSKPKHISFFSFKCDSCLTPGETGPQ